jgi:hypothetical protein
MKNKLKNVPEKKISDSRKSKMPPLPSNPPKKPSTAALLNKPELNLTLPTTRTN